MGRHRSLDIDKALPLIVRLFWRHGYDGITLDQVAQKLGVTKPTLYRSLGDKEEIFAKALVSYHTEFIKPGEDRLETAPNLESALTACFDVATSRMLNNQNPTGCFLTDTGLIGSIPVGPVSEILLKLQERAIRILNKRIAEAIDKGELEPATSASAVLQYVNSQMAALSALSHQKVSKSELRTIVAFMLQGLPWTRPESG
ncbi:MAG: TetR/AcrR family transcriptional regulator [Pseudomonadota bacterium]